LCTPDQILTIFTTGSRRRNSTTPHLCFTRNRGDFAHLLTLKCVDNGRLAHIRIPHYTYRYLLLVLREGGGVPKDPRRKTEVESSVLRLEVVVVATTTTTTDFNPWSLPNILPPT